MIRSMNIRGWLHLAACAALVLFGLASGPALAAPTRPDPRQMSGIPRPDAQIPAGELTVRVLAGGFDEPILGAMVQLELRSADGRRAELRTAEAGNQGRAHFRELADFVGGQAVALVMIEGELVRSQQIDLRADMGTAVMLVKGAVNRGPTQEISLPGIVFDFDKAPPGSLMVGTFDLTTGKGLMAMDVDLVITAPDGTTETRTEKTLKQGQVNFDGLGELAEGSTAQVRAKLDDGEPYVSMVFTPDATKGQAIVLAKGRMAAAGGSPHQAPNARAGQASPPGGTPHAPQRRALPGPQIDTNLPLGSVRILVVDGQDKPVADQAITIVKKDFAGTETRFSATTSAEGIARLDKLPVVSDALYYVGVVFDGGPYTSPFFGLDKRGGVAVAMRVWPITSDSSVAKSAVQFEVMEGENDAAQVIQVYEVLIGGDKAYWPGEEPLQIVGIEGAKGMVVLRGAEEWLDHDEKAPFATLSHPIPPGEVAALSIGYIIDGHGGELDFNWVPPFTLIESAIILSEDLTLYAEGAKPSEREFPPRPGLDYTPIAYTLGQTGTGPVTLHVEGLRQTDKIFAHIAIGVGVLMLLVVGAGVVLAPSRDPRVRLTARRDTLLEALSTVRSEAQRKRLVAALDRVYRQLDALAAVGESARPPRR